MKRITAVCLSILCVLFLCSCVTTSFPENAETPIAIQDPYGLSQETHPKVLDFGNQWNGYRYWMSYTPYPNGDSKKENPCIACSNDLNNWVAPEGFLEPIDEHNGEQGYNSDAHLLFNDETGMLECWWRYVDDSAKPEKVTIYRAQSADGSSWTAREVVMESADRSVTDWVSPAVIFEDGIYRVWFVAQRAVWYTESSDLEQWRSSEAVSLQFDDSTVWHIDVIRNNNLYQLLSVNYTLEHQDDHKKMSLYLSDSNDGIKFGKPSLVLSPGLPGSWDEYGLYRSSILRSGDKYQLLYSGFSKSGIRGIGHIDFEELPAQ